MFTFILITNEMREQCSLLLQKLSDTNIVLYFILFYSIDNWRQAFRFRVILDYFHYLTNFCICSKLKNFPSFHNDNYKVNHQGVLTCSTIWHWFEGVKSSLNLLIFFWQVRFISKMTSSRYIFILLSTKVCFCKKILKPINLCQAVWLDIM